VLPRALPREGEVHVLKPRDAGALTTSRFAFPAQPHDTRRSVSSGERAVNSLW
jgi:hypothetical protein